MDDNLLDDLLEGSDDLVINDEADEASQETKKVDDADQVDASSEEKPAEESTADSEQESEDSNEGHTVPVKTHVAERKKYQEERNRLQEELAQSRAKNAAYEVQQQQQPLTQENQEENAELMFDDPKKWEAQQTAKTDKAISEVKLEMQYENAVEKHGLENVQPIIQAMQDPKNKSLVDQFMTERNPIEAALKWDRDRKVQVEIGGDITAYKAKLKDEIKAEMRKEAGYTDSDGGQQTENIPPSITDTNGNSKGDEITMAQGMQAISDELFN